MRPQIKKRRHHRLLSATRWDQLTINRQPDEIEIPDNPRAPIPDRIVATNAEGTRLMAHVR